MRAAPLAAAAAVAALAFAGTTAAKADTSVSTTRIQYFNDAPPLGSSSRDELQCIPVHAEALAGGGGAVVEDVSQMAATPAAMDFGLRAEEGKLAPGADGAAKG